jgi:hypothetical protein
MDVKTRLLAIACVNIGLFYLLLVGSDIDFSVLGARIAQEINRANHDRPQICSGASEVEFQRELHEARIARPLRKAELWSSEFNRLWFFPDQAHRLEQGIHMVPDIEEL